MLVLVFLHPFVLLREREKIKSREVLGGDERAWRELLDDFGGELMGFGGFGGGGELVDLWFVGGGK